MQKRYGYHVGMPIPNTPVHFRQHKCVLRVDLDTRATGDLGRRAQPHSVTGNVEDSGLGRRCPHLTEHCDRHILFDCEPALFSSFHAMLIGAKRQIQR